MSHFFTDEKYFATRVACSALLFMSDLAQVIMGPSLNDVSRICEIFTPHVNVSLTQPLITTPLITTISFWPIPSTTSFMDRP